MRKKTTNKKREFSQCAKNVKPAEGSMRVWHIPQVPGKPFHVPIDLSEPLFITRAAEVLKTLARYDLFQYENKIKPDYASAQGLEIYEGGEWAEWENENGEDINEAMRMGYV